MLNKHRIVCIGDQIAQRMLATDKVCEGVFCRLSDSIEVQEQSEKRLDELLKLGKEAGILRNLLLAECELLLRASRERGLDGDVWAQLLAALPALLAFPQFWKEASPRVRVAIVDLELNGVVYLTEEEAAAAEIDDGDCAGEPWVTIKTVLVHLLPESADRIESITRIGRWLTASPRSPAKTLEHRPSKSGDKFESGKLLDYIASRFAKATDMHWYRLSVADLAKWKSDVIEAERESIELVTLENSGQGQIQVSS